MWLLTLAAAATLGAGALQAPAPAPGDSADADTAALRVEMRNVRLLVDGAAGIAVRELRGVAVPTTPGATAVLDDPLSFAIDVSAGTTALDGDALAALLNHVVFAYRGAPLRDLRVRVTDAGLVQSGVLHKGVDLRFTMASTVALTDDGRVRVHPTSMQILGVDGRRLLHALGLRLANLLDLRGAHGVSVSGDDLLLDPLAILPPPAVRGRVAALRVAGGALVMDFARTAADRAPDAASGNFVHFRGGRLRFGRLEMRDTDLLITDGDASTPLALYLPKYAEQLAAGWSRTMPDASLRVVMPDYGKRLAGAP